MCVCKSKKITKHHRRPRKQGGGNEDSNISLVQNRLHRAWHMLFSGDMTPEDIAERISDTWLDPRYKLVAVRK